MKAEEQEPGPKANSTSVWLDSDTADAMTCQAWETGAPLLKRSGIRLLDFGYPIGLGPLGERQTWVRVHHEPSTGEIFGHPSGPAHSSGFDPSRHPSFEEIRRRILGAYGSLSEPTDDFVADALARRPYRALIDHLASVLLVHEITDTNYEVCFSVSLAHQEDSWGLWLSMVGPYAVLIGPREAGGDDVLLVGSGDPPRRPDQPDPGRAAWSRHQHARPRVPRASIPAPFLA